jgi:hypothetical protein
VLAKERKFEQWQVRLKSAADQHEPPWVAVPLSASQPEVRQIEVEAPLHPLSHQLIEFWQSRCIGGRLMSRSDLPAREIAVLMRFLVLHAPVDSLGTDWRCRVEGSGIRERLGWSNTRGLTLAQRFPPQQASTGVALFNRVAQGDRPFVARGKFLGFERDFYEIETVMLPIEGDSGNRWIFGGLFFFE